MKSLASLLLLALPLVGKPLNVVFFLVDDLGYMDVSPNNPDTFYDTPNIQALADSGMRFTDAYAACPVCSPTRSSILTGQYPARTHNTDYFGAPNAFETLPENYDPAKDGKFGRHSKRPVRPAPYHNQLAADHTTLAESLKGHGYSTFFAGKWHLGNKGSWPTDHGFDINIGGTQGGGPYGGKKYFSPYGNPNLKDGPAGEHLPDRLATETAKFIADNKDGPFLAYLSFYSVHTPLIGRPDLVEKYKKKKEKLGLKSTSEDEAPRKNRTNQEHAIYAAMVEAMDLAIGKVLTALEDNGVADNPLVIFFSDNGGLSTSEGSPTSNLPLRAGKGWLYEGGIREPLLVRWPGVTKPGSTCDTPLISTDFFPTILDAAALPALPKQHKDGASFTSLLKDPTAKLNATRALYWDYPHWGNQGSIPGAAIREGGWKLIAFDYKKGTELYNLAEDPGEKTNLAGKNADRVKAMRANLDEVRSSTGAFRTSRNPDFNPNDFRKW